MLRRLDAPDLRTDPWRTLAARLPAMAGTLPPAWPAPAAPLTRAIAVGFRRSGDSGGSSESSESTAWLAAFYAQALGTAAWAADRVDAGIAGAARELPAGVPLLFFVPAGRFDVAWSLEAIETATRLGLPCGFLPIDPDPVAALEQVQRLVRLRRHPPAYPRATALFASFLQHDPPDCFGAGGESAFLRQIEQGASVSLLAAHSNGADLRLGSRVLCVQADHLAPAPGQPGETFLPCQAGGPCLRETMFDRMTFLGPDRFHNAAVVMLTCSGIVPADGAIDGRFSFTQALLRGDHVRSIVSATRVVMDAPELLLQARQRVEAGASTGALTLALNQRLHPGTPAYCCLGDPDVSLPIAPTDLAPAGTDRSAAAPRVIAFPTREAVIDTATAYTVASDLLAAARGRAPAALRRIVQPIADSLRSMAAQSLRDASAVPAAAHALLDRQLAAALAFLLVPLSGREAEARLPPAWLSTDESGPPCPVCAAPTRLRRYRSPLYAAGGRQQLHCASHGLLADLPGDAVDQARISRRRVAAAANADADAPAGPDAADAADGDIDGVAHAVVTIEAHGPGALAIGHAAPDGSVSIASGPVPDEDARFPASSTAAAVDIVCAAAGDAALLCVAADRGRVRIFRLPPGIDTLTIAGTAAPSHTAGPSHTAATVPMPASAPASAPPSPLTLSPAVASAVAPVRAAVDRRLQAAAATRALQAVLARNACQDGIVQPDAARPLVRALEAAARRLLTPTPTPAVARRLASPPLDARVCDLLAAICAARGGFVYPFFSGVGYDGPETRHAEPHVCGAPLFCVDTAQELFTGCRRRLWVCARCGLVGESTTDAQLPAVTQVNGATHLTWTGAGRSEAIDVALLLEPVGCVPARRLLRTRCDAGTLQRGLPLPPERGHDPAADIPGLRVLAIVLVSQADFLVARQPLRTGWGVDA